MASSASISLVAEQCCSVTKTSDRTFWAARKSWGTVLVLLSEEPSAVERRSTEGPGGGSRWILGVWGDIFCFCTFYKVAK